MANQKRKGKMIGVASTVLVHILFLVILCLIGFMPPAHEEESGVEVMMGNVAQAYGGFDPKTLVDVEVASEPASIPDVEEVPTPPDRQELLTQDEEETVAMKPEKKIEKETPKKETPKPVTAPKPVEKTAAEKEAEAKRLAEEKAERERKAAAEAAAKQVAGAFGKGAQMGSKGTADSGSGVEGSPEGNSSTGAKTGSGGYGTFDLGGRSIGAGGIPRPSYNVQEEGRVVVTITVNPKGEVIRTAINPLTNTVNTALRKSAEDAAKKARFNEVDGVSNQTGTITYYFNLK